VQTATGFGTLNSSQIAFSSGPQNYMALAYAAMAGLMVAAGMTPKLQFGEIFWWFQANASGMAFCDADTLAAAQAICLRGIAGRRTGRAHGVQATSPKSSFNLLFRATSAGDPPGRRSHASNMFLVSRC
jgi:hypothetical protein